MKSMHICFVCDAGMGSSAMGASLLRKLTNNQYTITNSSVFNIHPNARILITQHSLYSMIKNKEKYQNIYLINNLLDIRELKEIVKEIENKMEINTILQQDSIILGCQKCNHKEAIIAVGKVLQEKGYIEEPYIQGMLNRDENITTYIGNDIAIPHGEYDVKEYVKKTGIAVMIYPEGILWNGNLVRVVIGIAAKGDDHMAILSNIALTLSDMDAVNMIVDTNDIETIYNTLTKGV